jgi:ferrous iron transport protein A
MKTKPFVARERDMTDIAAGYAALPTSSSSAPSTSIPSSRAVPLGEAHRGFCGRINAIRADEAVHGRQADEIESRLIELGFVEGAELKILHEGPIGRDPIAVRINGTTIALRRREAMAILVTAS